MLQVDSRPDEVWASDVTELKFKRKIIYLCVILDLYARKIAAFRFSSKNSKFSLLKPYVTAYLMFITETHRSIFGVHSKTLWLNPEGLTVLQVHKRLLGIYFHQSFQAFFEAYFYSFFLQQSKDDFV